MSGSFYVEIDEIDLGRSMAGWLVGDSTVEARTVSNHRRPGDCADRQAMQLEA